MEGRRIPRRARPRRHMAFYKARGDSPQPLTERGPDPAEAHRQCGRPSPLLAVIFKDRGESPRLTATSCPSSPWPLAGPAAFHTGPCEGPPGQRHLSPEPSGGGSDGRLSRCHRGLCGHPGSWQLPRATSSLRSQIVAATSSCMRVCTGHTAPSLLGPFLWSPSILKSRGGGHQKSS